MREAARGDGFSVVLMSAPPRRIVPEPSEDIARVAREIKGLRLPHGNADVAGTLNTVENLLRHSPEKFEEREVYFLTDLQQSTWILKQPGQVSAALQKIQASARTIFIDVGEDGINNLAVTSLTLGLRRWPRPVPSCPSPPPSSITAAKPVTACGWNCGSGKLG